MFMIEIAGVRILYTGDFSRQEDRHLYLLSFKTPNVLKALLENGSFFPSHRMAAETPTYSADIVIVESTYGVQIHEPRLEREARFTS